MKNLITDVVVAGAETAEKWRKAELGPGAMAVFPGKKREKHVVRLRKIHVIRIRKA